MKKEDLEERLRQLEKTEEIRREVRVRCIAFWGVLWSAAIAIGNWAVGHSDALYAAFRAFLLAEGGK